MGSLIGKAIHYFCVSKANRTVYSYNSGDRELESLATLCLEKAPSFHAWYFETIGGRTFGFLMEDGHIYFAIADPSLENSEILRFLEHVRDRFKKVSKSRYQEELVPVIQRLISSLEGVSRPCLANQVPERSSLANQMPEQPSLPNESPPSSDGMTSAEAQGMTSTEAPLLGMSSSSKHDRKKMKDRVIEVRDIVTESYSNRGIKIDCPPEPVSAISVQRSSSSSRIRGQQKQVARKLWCRQVRIVIAVDVILCLVLFGIWLAVCRGFQCLSHG